jgi:hypothetical protein
MMLLDWDGYSAGHNDWFQTDLVPHGGRRSRACDRYSMPLSGKRLRRRSSPSTDGFGFPPPGSAAPRGHLPRGGSHRVR